MKEATNNEQRIKSEPVPSKAPLAPINKSAELLVSQLLLPFNIDSGAFGRLLQSTPYVADFLQLFQAIEDPGRSRDYNYYHSSLLSHKPVHRIAESAREVDVIVSLRHSTRSPQIFFLGMLVRRHNARKKQKREDNPQDVFVILRLGRKAFPFVVACSPEGVSICFFVLLSTDY